MKTTSRILLGFLLAMIVQTAGAGPNYVTGRIVNVSFAGAEIYIMVDSGLPDNCVGTPFGWMVIPASGKAMAAYVLGLKLSGDLSQAQLAVYTAGRDASGYCQINQIDPYD